MTYDEFKTESGKLQRFYGNGQFNDSKLDILWDVVAPMNREWFARVIKKFLQSSKVSPMPVDFLELKKVELRSIEAEQDRNKHDQTFTSIFSEQERREMFDMVMRISSGELDKNDIRNFRDTVISALENNNINFCRICENSGIVTAQKNNTDQQSECWLRCSCKKGNAFLQLPIFTGNRLIQISR